MADRPDDEAERIAAENRARWEAERRADSRAKYEASWAKMNKAQLSVESMEVKARPEVERWFREKYGDDLGVAVVRSPQPRKPLGPS